uniref:Uncharacterized protein n=1 Tax=Pavo cristatus TaxID=9049 RepID=A0A8C9G6P4_PAVCR
MGVIWGIGGGPGACVGNGMGVTNGGKTTLTNRIVKALPNCCVVHQDDFFKVSVGCGFLGYQEIMSGDFCLQTPGGALRPPLLPGSAVR